MADPGTSPTPTALNVTSTVADTSMSSASAQAEASERRPSNSQPALATSKRKFHQILENLTKPSTSSKKRALDTPYSYTDSPAKRIRQEARARLEANSIPTRTAPAHFQSQLLRSRLDAAKAASVNRSSPDPTGATSSEPNYVPWSHEAFLRRLQTFADVSKWSSKPDAVNEVAWARRGWVCVGVNTVACKGGCEQRVVVGLRPKRKDEQGHDIDNSEDFSAEIDDELVKRVADLIVFGHEDGCLWKSAGCRDDIYRLPITRPVVWQPQLRERYLSFVAIASDLPPPSDLSCPVDVSTIANLLPPDLLNTPQSVNAASSSDNGVDHNESSNQVNQSALAFALFGWSATVQSAGYPLASCSHCFRRLGLWLYKRLATDDDINSESMKLNLVENHRDYCPWINAESQAIPGSKFDMPAWKVLTRGIENDAGFRGWSKSSIVGRQTNSSPLVFGESQEEAPSTSHSSPAPSTRSKEDIAKEDQARFTKLRELSKAIGLKRIGIKEKLGRLKPAVGSGTTSLDSSFGERVTETS